MNIDEFQKHDWQYVYTRRMSTKKLELYFDSYVSGFRELFGYNTRYSAYRCKNGDVSAYFEKDEIFKLGKHLGKRFGDSQYIQQHIKGIPESTKKAFDVHKKFLKSVPKDFSQLSVEKLNAWVEKMYRADEKIAVYYWIYFTTVEDALSQALEVALKNVEISKKEVDEIIRLLSEPHIMTPLDREHASLLNVALADEQKRQSMLVKHWEEYRYMPVYDMHYSPLMLDHFKEKLEVLLAKQSSDAIAAEIRKIEEKYKKREENHREILTRFNESTDVYILLQFFGDYGYFKDMKPYYRDKTSCVFRPLFQEMAQRLGVTLDEILYLTQDELRTSLRMGQSCVSKKNLKERISSSLFICENNSKIFITDTNSLLEVDHCLKMGNKEKEVTGLVAYKGKTQGRIRIILSNNDFGKFREGDVLVASATRPDYVPLMKKAIAIVTDEGGTLSHAAIVSRELKIPCIVGTKIATQTFKDGDLVEVDAEKGVVRMLKKSS